MADDEKPAQPDRWALLTELEDWLEVPMQVLGFIWLGLLVLDLTKGLNGLLAALSTLIWIIFIADFAIRLAIAPDKRRFFKRNWLGALSLLVPALRVLRVPRAIAGSLGITGRSGDGEVRERSRGRATPSISIASVAARRPAVSTRVTRSPSSATSSVIRSRVVPGISVTIARAAPASALKMLDFPTLGLPMMTT